jgi:hypothetical protein
MLIPLKQFICDTCGEIIEKPEDGWIEWIHSDDGMQTEFNIVHHAGSSPRKIFNHEGCYQHGGRNGRMDNNLNQYINPNVIMSFLLHFLDIGRHHDPSRNYIGKVNISEYVELVRRLTIPYYEEARLYWEMAKNDGYFDGENEISIYSVNFLKGIIDKYSK